MKEYKVEFTKHIPCVDYIEADSEEEAIMILNKELKQLDENATISKVEFLQEYD